MNIGTQLLVTSKACLADIVKTGFIVRLHSIHWSSIPKLHALSKLVN
jgi:hypothetical protein